MYTRKTSILLMAMLFFTALHIQAQSLNGTYTLDPKGGGDFTSFSELETSLRTNGVSGPVTVDVLPGTYAERVTFSNIKGLSAKSPVVIQGDGPGTTLLEYNTSSSSNRSVVRIENLSFFTFRDIGVKSTGTSYGWGIHVYSTGTAVEEVNIINCSAEVRAIGSSNYAAIVFNGSLTSYSSSGRPYKNCTVDSCTTLGGYTGIMFASNRSSSTATGNRILNTKVEDYYYYGIYLNSLHGFEVSGCSIVSGNTTTGSAVGLQYFNNSSSGTNVIKINGNHFDHPGRYGIYLSSAQGGNSTTVAAQRGQMFNNMIVMDGGYSDTRGIYTTNTYSGYFDIWHNSVVIENTNGRKTSACVYYQGNYCSIMNNNLAYLASSGSALPLYIPVPPTGLEVDYNNYYNNAGNTLLEITSAYSGTTFKGGGGYNAHSFNVDPNFVSSKDLHLKHTSAFPFGNSNAVVEDFDGDERCKFASSLGADQSEFVPTGKPAFKAQDSIYIKSPSIFLNQGDPLDPVEYTWSIDGTPEGKGFNFTYSFPAAGKYDVTLTTTSCLGTTSNSTITVTVVKQTSKPVADFSVSATVVETGEELDIKDLSSNGPTKWKYRVSPNKYYNDLSGLMEPTYFYSDGDELSPEGRIGFDAPGKYEICLVVENSEGEDSTCRKEIVEVLYTDEMCSFYDQSKEAKGVLYDDGGKGPYATNRNCSYLIEPCGGAVVLDFEQLNLAAGDYLRIYDGANNQATPLWDVNNYGSGLTGDLTGIHLQLKAESGRAFIEFETDNGTTTVSSGFKLIWSVDPKTFTAPIAAFSNADTVCVDAETIFKNESQGTNMNFEWWVDGNLVSSEASAYEETFLFAGTYDVKLRAINCGGVDSVTKSIKVVSQAKTARPAFSASDVSPNTGDKVELWNMTTYCHESVVWDINPKTYQFEDGTDAETNNPVIRFLQPGCYDVTLEVENAMGATKQTRKCFIEVGKYCVPTTQVLSADLGITRFAMDDLDNSSDANSKGYTSYTSGTRGTLVKGASYVFELERGGTSNNFSANIWIDIDGDGVFASTELLASKQNISGKVWKDTVKMPIAASSITTRMRVQTSSAFALPAACGPNAIGEYEDYSVTIMVDNEAPEITLVGAATINIEEGFGYTEPGFSAYDTQSGDVTKDVVVNSNVDDKLAGTYQISYDVEDEAGNKAATVTRTVIVSADTTKPVVSIVGKGFDTIYVKDTYTDLRATATDVLDGVLGGIQRTYTLDSSKIGTYTITYSATDSRNNVGVAMRYVTVLDSTRPVIALIGKDTVDHEVLIAYADLGVTLTDNHDDPLTIKQDVSTTLDIETPGIYPYTICATDQSGNVACVTRYVDVADRTLPSIVLRGKDTITHEVNTDFIDPWVLASDNFSRNVVLTTGGDYDGTPDELGFFTIWYYAQDDAGNMDSVKRVLEIVDTTPPEITLEGDDVVVVSRWEDFDDPGVTVSDNFDAVADIVVTTNGDFDNTQSNGRYFISYQAEDQNGNKSVIITRIVDVEQPTTGIAEPEEQSFTLYPNPTSAAFVVRTEFNRSESLQLEVRDVSGRLLYSQSYTNIMELNTEISTADWTAGAYFVALKTQNQVMVERLSVVR